MRNCLRIGLVINRSYSHYRKVLQGIGRFAESKPGWVFTSMTPELTSGTLRGWQTDAVIASVNTTSLQQVFAKYCRPIVNVSQVLTDLSCPRVGVDNAQVGQLAAAHFLERGLRHFGFVGPPGYQYSVERRVAFCESVQKAGFAVHCHILRRHLPFDTFSMRWDLDRSVYRWLKGLPKPVGVFVPSDEWGIQYIQACREVQLRVPDEIAVLGSDDDDLGCELTRPRLSSVIVPSQRIGFEAAALVDQLLSGQKVPHDPVLVQPLGVAVRESTDTLAVADRDLVAAVRFIRDHTHLQLTVDDVLREVPIGRRSLERRCHRSLGWGLAAEIRRTRIERASHLLAATDMSITTVAEQSGFSSFRHMATVFRQQVGMAPTGFRRQHRTASGNGDMAR